MYRSTISSFILGLLFVQIVLAGKLSYHNIQVHGDETSIARVAMFSSDDAPSKTPPGNGHSYVTIDVDLTKQYDEDGTVGVFVFHSDAIDNLGETIDGKVYLCCSESLMNRNDCGNGTEIGDVIWRPHALLLHVENTTFNGTSQISVFEKYNVKKSGTHYVYFVNCKASGIGTVTIDGTVTFMNPYGYLNGEMYYFMPFCISLAIFYLLFLIAWLGLSFKYYNQVVTLQYWITGVIFLGFIEALTWYFDYLGYNISGKNYVAAMVTGVFVSTIKRTVMRVLVLVISLGYGSVIPTLGTTSYKIGMLGVGYFMFSGTLSIVELVQRTTELSLNALIFLMLPVSALELCFFLWIVKSLPDTVSQLRAINQMSKSNKFKHYSVALLIIALFALLIMVVGGLVAVGADADDTWQINWLWTAFWFIFYLAILLATAVLWRPISDNTRYNYSEVGMENAGESNDGNISLNSFNLVTHITRAPLEDQLQESN